MDLCRLSLGGYTRISGESDRIYYMRVKNYILIVIAMAMNMAIFISNRESFSHLIFEILSNHRLHSSQTIATEQRSTNLRFICRCRKTSLIGLFEKTRYSWHTISSEGIVLSSWNLARKSADKIILRFTFGNSNVKSLRIFQICQFLQQLLFINPH